MGWGTVNVVRSQSGLNGTNAAPQHDPAPLPVPRTNAVLVLGASGRLGRLIVAKVHAQTSVNVSPLAKNSCACLCAA